MNQNQERLAYLFQAWYNNTCTKEERTELMMRINATGENEELSRLITAAWQKPEDPAVIISAEQSEAMLKHILGEEQTGGSVYRIGSRKRRVLWRYVAAAAVFIALSLSVYFIIADRKSLREKITAGEQVRNTTDIPAPGAANAIITFADGSTIVLDSARNGKLAMQGNIDVVKLADGEIAYNGSATSNKVSYNTLTVPRGSKVVSLMLTDGTRAWLNSESSLRYPTAFIGNERRVEITGEVYFEVAKLFSLQGERVTFTVQRGDAEVEVLGTHFNISAYDDESSIKVTLLEGSVKVKKANEAMLLRPGEQAAISKTGRISLDKTVDTDEVVAWKNGWFDFRSLSIQDIMQQVGRWYDVEVNYSGTISDSHFSGIVSRSANISQVLKIMEQAGVKFDISGNPPAGQAKKITVL